MNDLFNRLLDMARSEELRETIRFFRDRNSFAILYNPSTGKYHPGLAHQFTYIGNMAAECGEQELAQVSRLLRDMLLENCDKEFHDLSEYVRI